MNTNIHTTPMDMVSALLTTTCDEEVLKLLETGLELNCSAFGGFTYAHLADYSPASLICTWLGDSTSRTAALPAEYASISRLTPLHVQALRGNKAMVELLIRKNHDNLFALSDAGDRPIDMTTYPEIITLLREAMGEASVEELDTSRNATPHINRTRSVASPLLRVESAEKVAELVQAGFEVNCRDERGLTPLHLARNAEIARALLDAGADFNLRCKAGLTPLLYTDHADVEAVLLAAGARVDGCNEDGTPDVFAAAGRGKLQLFKEHGADLAVTLTNGVNGLFHVRRVGDLKLFLEAGLDPNKSYMKGLNAWHMSTSAEVQHGMLDAGLDLTGKNIYGFNALAFAADETVVRRLLQQGIDVHAVDFRGRTPLFFSLSASAYDALIKAGCDVNHRCFRGNTPLFAVSGKPHLIEALLMAGADVHARNNLGQTPLHRACTPKTIRLLIEAGADVNARANDGSTPLHLSRIPECAEALLQAGANPNARNAIGITPLHLATNPEVVELLLAHGAEVNAVADNGRTPLHYAISVPVAELLLEHGASPFVKDKDGHLPCTRAVSVPLSSLLENAIYEEIDKNAPPRQSPRIERLWEVLQHTSLEDMRSALDSLIHQAEAGCADVAPVAESASSTKRETQEIRSSIRARLFKKYQLSRHEELETWDWCDIMDDAVKSLSEREFAVMVELADEYAGNEYWTVQGARLCLNVREKYSADMFIRVAKIADRRFPLADPDNKFMAYLLHGYEPALIRRLVEEVGLPVNAEFSGFEVVPDGTLLCYAAREGLEDLCVFLLEKGADPALAVREQSCPLVEAVVNAHHAIARLLLEHGAPQQNLYYMGRPFIPLAHAREHHDLAMMDILAAFQA